MKKKITIVDYGAGNIKSIQSAITKLGYENIITNDPKQIENSNSIILPGVGAYATAMEKLNKFKLVEPLIKYAKSDRPLLGICLGMQLLCSSSDEFVKTKGLNLVPGTVKKLSNINSFKGKKLPVIGWFKVSDSKNFKNKINSNDQYYYHLHSFYCELQNEEHQLFSSKIFGINICTGINKNNIFGFQFHPEKSRENGLMLIDKFCQLM